MIRYLTDEDVDQAIQVAQSKLARGENSPVSIVHGRPQNGGNLI